MTQPAPPPLAAVLRRFAWLILASLLAATALVWAAFAGLRAVIGWR